MQAIVRSRYGSPDVLDLREVPTPSPGAGEVLVAIHAASVNRADIDYLTGIPFITKMGTGLRRPRHAGLGLDAAGVVESVGTGVTRFAPGDRVFGNLTMYGYGAFAEYACAPERAWAPMPGGASFEQAAALPEASIIAWQGLRGGSSIRPGDGVLINGASGNVGPFAVQLAKSFGAEVTGVCSTPKMDFVRIARGRPRHRLHAERLHADGTPLPVHPGRLGSPVIPCSAAGAQARRPICHGRWDHGRDLRGPAPGAAHVDREWPEGRPCARLEAIRPDGHRDVVAAPGDGRHPAGDRPPLPLAEVPDALRDLQAGRPMGKLIIRVRAEETMAAGIGGA